MKNIKIRFVIRMKESQNKLIEHEVSFDVDDDWKDSPMNQIRISEYGENILRENIEITKELISEIDK